MGTRYSNKCEQLVADRVQDQEEIPKKPTGMKGTRTEIANLVRGLERTVSGRIVRSLLTWKTALHRDRAHYGGVPVSTEV